MTSAGSSTPTPSCVTGDPFNPFEAASDVGSVRHPGACTYNAETQEYTITGSGSNMWFDQDHFHYVWKRMSGDFMLTARVHFVGAGVEEHRKVGWIVRASLDANSAHVGVALHGDGLTSLPFRRTPGAMTEEVKASVTGADVLQLERKGSTYTMAVARFGAPFVTEQVTDIDQGDDVYVGLFVCSHHDDIVETAIFDNVRIVVPTKEGFVPYQDYLGSNLEILDVTTGSRRLIYASPDPFEAPNWTPDANALIYNGQGHLYRFDLAKQTPTVINTDFAIKNNNDHVLSFDGRMIGISHHSAEDQNRSIVYTLPVEGGTPQRVTALGPSYLHGWSPDGRFLVYTGERNGNFDIYRIPVDGGEEVRLTTAEGLDDGAEYTPDGSYIYFNSVRTGTMQLWRMKPDGSAQEQVTDDQFNNWFPHVSPDGKSIVFLSYGLDVDPSAHPYYKQVYLRLLPIEGGQPRVLAYLYGGQGTINVPSWSPDSRHLAFVSNTGLH